MRTPSTFTVILACGALAGLTGCAATPPGQYTELPASQRMHANDSDKMPFLYLAPVRWSDYGSIMIEPVAIYTGADHQFGTMREADKRLLAQTMSKAFTQALSRKFAVASTPAVNTLRLKLTLTGAKTNTAVVSTVTRFDLVGLPYNAVQSMRGREGIFMGSVGYSVEIYDAANGTLLMAYVAKQYPNAMNVGATVGALSAAETGIEKGATDLLTKLQ